jgi:hypothetical protein
MATIRSRVQGEMTVVEHVNCAFGTSLLYQNRGAEAEQLDEGIVDTIVLDDVFGE